MFIPPQEKTISIIYPYKKFCNIVGEEAVQELITNAHKAEWSIPYSKCENVSDKIARFAFLDIDLPLYGTPESEI